MNWYTLTENHKYGYSSSSSLEQQMVFNVRTVDMHVQIYDIMRDREEKVYEGLIFPS